MSKIALSGPAGGTATYTVTAPTGATDRTLTLPDANGTLLSTGSTFAGTGPAFSAYASSSQSVTSLTATKVTLDTEIFDTNNTFASSRFTPTVAGYYQINGTLRTGASSAITNAGVFIYKNGSSYARGAENSSGKSNNQLVVSSVVYLNGSGDYVELYGFVEGTSPSFNYNSADITSMFSGALVRAS
jgi:hypothetical protein